MYGSIVGKLAPETTASWKPQLSVTDFGAIHDLGLREACRLTRFPALHVFALGTLQDLLCLRAD